MGYVKFSVKFSCSASIIGSNDHHCPSVSARGSVLLGEKQVSWGSSICISNFINVQAIAFLELHGLKHGMFRTLPNVCIQ